MEFTQTQGLPLGQQSQTAAPVETQEPVQIVEPTNVDAAPENTNQDAVNTDKAIDISIDAVDSSNPAEPTNPAEPIEQQKPFEELLKEADRAVVLKALGLDWVDGTDEFIKEFAEFRKNGGDPYKYLEAKTFDWNKVTDEDIAMQDLAKQYPTLSEDDLKVLFENKYKTSDEFTEDEKRVAGVLLKADAAKGRSERIEESKKFVIPNIEPKAGMVSVSEIEKQQAEAVEQGRAFVVEHELTKSLLQSKKVTVDAGEFGKFNLGIENPNELIGFMNDKEVYQKYSLTPEGKPDMEKAYLSALLHINPKGFIKSFINYGKEMAAKSIIEEGRNAGRIEAPASAEPVKQVWKST